MKLTAKLPAKDVNGLTAIEGDMVNRPDRCVTIVAIVDVHKLTTDMDTDDVEATVRIVAVEALTTDLDAQQARRLLDAARTRRTGGQMLPLNGMVDAVADAAFQGGGIDSVSISRGGRTVTRTRNDDDDVDPETGEIRAS